MIIPFINWKKWFKWDSLLIVFCLLVIIWFSNLLGEVIVSMNELPSDRCGLQQHGDTVKRMSLSPMYTPFWLDDPCTGFGFSEPRY